MSPRPRILSVIGARPEIMQAAPVSAALADLAEEILVHTGQHYDAGDVRGLQIADLRLPLPRVQPRRRLAARATSSVDDRRRSGSAEVIEPRAPRRRPRPRRHQRDARRRPRRGRRRRAAHPRRGRPAQLPRRHARGANRIETDRLSDLLFAPDASTPATTSSPRASRAASRSPATPLRRPAASRWRAAIVPARGRVRARHRPPQLQHRLARAARRRARLPRPLAAGA